MGRDNEDHFWTFVAANILLVSAGVLGARLSGVSWEAALGGLSIGILGFAIAAALWITTAIRIRIHVAVTCVFYCMGALYALNEGGVVSGTHAGVASCVVSGLAALAMIVR